MTRSARDTPETRTVRQAAWANALNREIDAGRLLVESSGILSSLTPDIATADGSLIALWHFHPAPRGLPAYYNALNGYWAVYRNGRLIWRTDGREGQRMRLYKLFAVALGIDVTRTEIETVTWEWCAKGPDRIPALVAQWAREGRKAA